MAANGTPLGTRHFCLLLSDGATYYYYGLASNKRNQSLGGPLGLKYVLCFLEWLAYLFTDCHFHFASHVLGLLHNLIIQLVSYENGKLNIQVTGGRQSSMVSSVPTILRPWVWIPSAPSTIFWICIIEIVIRKGRKLKEAGIGPF